MNYIQINIWIAYHLQIKNVLDNIHKDFAVVPIDKDNIALVCKRFYASVITRELGLNNNSSTDTYNNAGGLFENQIWYWKHSY